MGGEDFDDLEDETEEGSVISGDENTEAETDDIA